MMDTITYGDYDVAVRRSLDTTVALLPAAGSSPPPISPGRSRRCD